VLTASVVATVVFGYLAVRDVKWQATWHALAKSNYAWLVPTFLAVGVSVVLRAIRWQALFMQEHRPGLAPITKAMLVGLFFNIILPARAGEAARIVALKSYAGTSLAETTATIVVERLIDILALLGLLFVCSPWLPHITWLRAAGILAMVALAATALLLAIVIQFARGRAPKLVGFLARLPWLDEARVERMTGSVLDGLLAVRRPRQAAAVFALTTLSWLVLGLAFWFLMIGFHMHLPVLAGLLVAIATGLSFIVPAAPGGLGVFEAAGLAATGAYGIAKSQALGYVLVLHAVNVIPFLILGAVVLATTGLPDRRGIVAPSSAGGGLRSDV
jgi:uncharacterized protein (TIRG00374 family)